MTMSDPNSKVPKSVTAKFSQSMDKYLVPLKPSSEAAIKPRRGWKRSLIEVNGRFEPKYRHHLSSLLLQSFSEIGAFPHLYHAHDGGFAGGMGNVIPCPTHMNRVGGRHSTTKQGISALEFDNKGIYLVSVTKAGCLTVHDFESLHRQAADSFQGFGEDESKHVLHLSLRTQLDAIRWNVANQDEVACTSMKSNEVLIFDIGYVTSEPVEVLSTKPTVTVHGSPIHNGLTDIVFNSDSRLIACDTNGGISIWDRRAGVLPCLLLTSKCRSTLNSVQLHVDNQMVFGAGRLGTVYMWDLRGGSTASALQIHKEVCHPPITSWKLSSMLGQIGSLKAQSDIVPKEVHSIDFNPSCPYQLAFHLDDGWSGVFDINNFRIMHVHCPAPAWLNGSNTSTDMLHLRKPSWLQSYSVYVVGSSAENGIHLLDFYPDLRSPCHVNYRGYGDAFAGGEQNIRNRFIPLSEGVTACTTNPLNGTIIAGTKLSSLLVVSQRKESSDQAEALSMN